MKVFISQPMNGKTREEIIRRRSEIELELKQKYPKENIIIIDSLTPENSKGPVWSLGYSIQCMDEAELVVFDKGWRQARGCKIEYNVCAYYGYRFLEL